VVAAGEFDQERGAVGGGVVEEKGAVEQGGQVLGEGREYVGFVAQQDDNGKVHGGGSPI
jgi:hypothetical protein